MIPLSGSTAKVLVVDDTAGFRDIVGRLLEHVPGLSISYAADGVEAVEAIERGCPDLILTDLNMPRLNGLELVELVRNRQLPAAVVVMTAFGSEQTVVDVLKKGAAGYISKEFLARDLKRVISDVLETSRGAHRIQQFRQSLVRSDLTFRLGCDPALVPPLVDRLLDDLESLNLRDAEGRVQIGIALREALANAIFHGNLAVSSELRELDGNEFYSLATRRQHEEPYRSRKIEVRATTTPDQAVYVIKDEGAGFCPALVPNPTDPENLLRASGRGLFLIRTFVDEVEHNEVGNQITMRIKPRN
jgi:CheY-like chemotaxis protein